MKPVLTACYQKVPQGYIAFIAELPGANSQGKTLAAARNNLRDALALLLDTTRQSAEESLEADVIREKLIIGG